MGSAWYSLLLRLLALLCHSFQIDSSINSLYRGNRPPSVLVMCDIRTGAISDAKLQTETLDFCPPLNHIPRELPYLGPDYSQAEKTILEILDTLEQTQAFVNALRPFEDLASRLSDLEANSTVWAVSNAVVQTGCKGKTLHACLSNHISPHWVPTIREMTMPNTPTLFYPTTLNGEARVHTSLSVSETSETGRRSTAAVMLNRHSRVIQHDIMASNGVIHLVDAYLPPLKPLSQFIKMLPEAEFSLLQKAVKQTDFLQVLAEAKLHGATFFAPSDTAFKRLDLERVESLFAKGHGTSELEIILRGHLVPNRTLFSNAFYDDNKLLDKIDGAGKQGSQALLDPADRKEVQADAWPRPKPKHKQYYEVMFGSNCYKVPWGRKQFRLPTMLEGRVLTVNIARAGGLIEMFIGDNGDYQAGVTEADFLCSEGIVHIVDRLLIADQQTADQ